MLKKIMKAALAASLAFGISSLAYAADFSVGGNFRSYFGQYTTGSEDYTPHFKVFEEANVKFNGKVDKLSVYHEMESATGDDYNNTQTRLRYATPIGLLTIGNTSSVGTVPLATSGWSTPEIPNSTLTTLAVSGYSENEALQLTVPLEEMGIVQLTIYEDADNYVGNFAQGIAAYSGASVPTTTEGSSMQLATNLKFGMVGIRAGYAIAKTDDPASSDDDAMSTNNMLVGIKVYLSEQMAVAFDYATSKTSYDTWGDDIKFNALDISFSMGGVGPGKIVLAYNTTAAKGSDDIYSSAMTSVLFDMPLGKGVGMQLGYIASALKPETAAYEAVLSQSALLGRTEGTESFMGVGLYAFF